ncbi:MAG: ABC transporter permease [Acidimicrobiales bacterium]
MGRHLARRVLGLVSVLLGVSVVTFGLGALAPGDPADIDLQANGPFPYNMEEYQARRNEMGLDRPLPAQYLSWLSRAATGDLGSSWSRREPVSTLLARHIPPTALLAFVSTSLAVGFAVPLGVLAASHHRGWADHAARLVSLIGSSVPGYFLAYVLIVVLAVGLKLLPVFGSGTPAHLVMPALTLALGAGATICRVTRANVLEALGGSFITAARARGCTPQRILGGHALPLGIAPISTVIALVIGSLLGGVVIVETIFSWPGIGQLTVAAIMAKDFPLLQGAVMLAATVYVLVNFLADVASAMADPRVTV